MDNPFTLATEKRIRVMEELNNMDSPYIETEEKIMEHLAEAYNLFIKLEQTHPSHNRDFSDGIHKAQDLILHRICQRDYPNYFPTHKRESE